LRKILHILDDLAISLQAFRQLFGIPLTYIRYGFRLPNAERYISECQYSLPFDGRWYVANGGITKETSHSWGICSQRYAYDFHIVDERAQSYAGDRKVLENYYCYKQNVLSPADGIVVTVNNGCVDSPIVEEGQATCVADDIRGNFIIIRHGKREYSLIAHLLINSICVNPGDKVTRGQIIARCGNSGNSSEPHIHFQIQAGKSFLLSTGLPIKFYNIEIGDRQLGDSFITKEQFVRNN